MKINKLMLSDFSKGYLWIFFNKIGSCFNIYHKMELRLTINLYSLLTIVTFMVLSIRSYIIG